MEILIVDDDRVFVQLASRRLKAKGFTITAAFDGMQATMMAMRTPSPDAILLDFSMPARSGIEVLRRIKESVKSNHIPVIVLSGSTDPELPKTVRELGAEEFLPKPVDFNQLYHLLCHLCGKPDEE